MCNQIKVCSLEINVLLESQTYRYGHYHEPTAAFFAPLHQQKIEQQLNTNFDVKYLQRRFRLKWLHCWLKVHHILLIKMKSKVKLKTLPWLIVYLKCWPIND